MYYYIHILFYYLKLYFILQESDTEEQIHECLTKIIIKKFTTNEMKEAILNPNEMQDIDLLNDENCTDILNYLIHQKYDTNKKETFESTKYKSSYLMPEQLKNRLLKVYQNTEFIENVSSQIFKNIIENNQKRFVPKIKSNTNSEANASIITLINSICHPEIISSIKDKYIQNINKLGES